MSTRIAIIDHDSHELIVEDINDELLARYGGDEQKYIDDNYPHLENYSWDYICDASYMPEDVSMDMCEINFLKCCE